MAELEVGGEATASRIVEDSERIISAIRRITQDKERVPSESFLFGQGLGVGRDRFFQLLKWLKYNGIIEVEELGKRHPVHLRDDYATKWERLEADHESILETWDRSGAERESSTRTSYTKIGVPQSGDREPQQSQDVPAAYEKSADAPYTHGVVIDSDSGPVTRVLRGLLRGQTDGVHRTGTFSLTSVTLVSPQNYIIIPRVRFARVWFRRISGDPVKATIEYTSDILDTEFGEEVAVWEVVSEITHTGASVDSVPATITPAVLASYTGFEAFRVRWSQDKPGRSVVEIPYFTQPQEFLDRVGDEYWRALFVPFDRPARS